MARTAVTYEQVEAVANALYCAGLRDPSGKAVRDELAKRAGPGMPVGSPNTIQRHLILWREKGRPVDQPLAAPAIPGQLAADIARALEATALAARAQSERRLLQVQAELDDLAAHGEAYEAQIDELSRTVAERTTERDTVIGRLQVQAAEVERLTQALEQGARTYEDLRLDVERCRAQREACDARATHLLNDVEAAHDRLATTNAELASEKEARFVAERRADVLEAKLQITNETLAAAESRVKNLDGKIHDAESLAHRAAAAEATVVELRDVVEMLKKLLAGKDASDLGAGESQDDCTAAGTSPSAVS